MRYSILRYAIETGNRCSYFINLQWRFLFDRATGKQNLLLSSANRVELIGSAISWKLWSRVSDCNWGCISFNKTLVRIESSMHEVLETEPKSFLLILLCVGWVWTYRSEWTKDACLGHHSYLQFLIAEPKPRCSRFIRLLIHLQIINHTLKIQQRPYILSLSRPFCKCFT